MSILLTFLVALVAVSVYGDDDKTAPNKYDEICKSAFSNVPDIKADVSSDSCSYYCVHGDKKEKHSKTQFNIKNGEKCGNGVEGTVCFRDKCENAEVISKCTDIAQKANKKLESWGTKNAGCQQVCFGKDETAWFKKQFEIGSYDKADGTACQGTHFGNKGKYGSCTKGHCIEGPKELDK